ncbi:MAG: DUF5681 domain-containing protein [Deltaproteobacteria bacterium]|nr:DUF5681 domain-containing protein [Deltaproteobacteria bacterium]
MATTRRKPNPGQFKPGQSGNPTGRPKGSKHKATLAAQALLDGEAEGLTRKCIKMGLNGDPVALRLCLERLVPPRKDGPISIKLPAMKTAGDAVKVSGAIIGAVARGDLTPSEGEALARMVETHRRTLELEEIERRLTALEQSRGEQ